MAAYIEQLININPYSRPGTKLTAVKKLVVHYTANPGGTAENHFAYFGKSLIERNEKLPKEDRRYASAHIFVDKKWALNIIPMDEVAYHANDVQKHNADGSPYRGVKELLPNANFLSIGVELCIEKDGTFHPDTIALAVLVFAELCKKFNLTAEDIIRHYDVTAKNCPAPWVEDGQAFIDFKNSVAAELQPKKPAVKVAESKAVLWDGAELSPGQIGRITILKPINLWRRVGDKLELNRILEVGERFRVYKYDEQHGGQYGVGAGLWITKMDGYIKYETPSKKLLNMLQ